MLYNEKLGCLSDAFSRKISQGRVSSPPLRDLSFNPSSVWKGFDYLALPYSGRFLRTSLWVRQLNCEIKSRPHHLSSLWWGQIVSALPLCKGAQWDERGLLCEHWKEIIFQGLSTIPGQSALLLLLHLLICKIQNCIQNTRSTNTKHRAPKHRIHKTQNAKSLSLKQEVKFMYLAWLKTIKRTKQK